MANKNKLSIYLLKKDCLDNKEHKLISSENYTKTIIEDVGTVYYETSRVSAPVWVESFFRGRIDKDRLFTSNARAVLISSITTDNNQIITFAITMGYGKNMLDDDIVVEDFGIKVVLNTITPSSLKRIGKVNIGGNLKTSNEQLPLESDINDFGFDIERDLISTITGRSEDDDFVSGIITGSDILSLSANVDISNLKSFLKQVYKKYTSTKYRNDFSWIDQIRRVRTQSLINELNDKLVQLLVAESSCINMAPPEPIEWENIQGFKYAGRDVYDDIDISVLVKSFKNGLNNIDQIKRKRILIIGTDDGESRSWSAFNCIFGEIELNEQMYCINNGRWYRVDNSFVEVINSDYNSIPISTIRLIPFNTELYKSEAEYNIALVEANPRQMLLMDKKNISYGGGKSKIELCDVLVNNNTFIHVKAYSGSSVLSHLFNQAVVSAELVMGDSLFLNEANKKIMESTTDSKFIIRDNSRKSAVLAIISNNNTQRPILPFFSKVALRHARKRLQSIGCSVFVSNIPRT